MSSFLVLNPKSTRRRRAVSLYHKAVGPTGPGSNLLVWPVQTGVVGDTSVPIPSTGGIVDFPFTVTWSPQPNVANVMLDVPVWFRLDATVLETIENDYIIAIVNGSVGAAQDFITATRIPGDSAVPSPLEYEARAGSTGRIRCVVPNTGLFVGKVQLKCGAYSTSDYDSINMSVQFYDLGLATPLQ